MMSDRRIDITGLQVLASVLATVTGTVASSYLGIAGTIIGAAVMSVASTAGSAMYKHYLGRTARRLKGLKEAAPIVAHKAAERMTAAGTHARPHHHHNDPPVGQGWPPPGSRLPGFGDEPNSRAASSPGERPGERPGEWPVRETAASPGEAGDRATGGYQDADGVRRLSLSLPFSWLGRLRGRPRWLLGGLAAIGLFAGVVGGITLVELATGKPLEAVVWHRSGSGTTVGGIVGSRPSHSPAPSAPQTKPPGTTSPPSTPGSSPVNSPTPSPTPSSSLPSPPSSGSSSPAPNPSSPAATPASPLPSARPQPS
jgi:hypothetical protein